MLEICKRIVEQGKRRAAIRAAEDAIEGLDGVTLIIAESDDVPELLEDVLGEIFRFVSDIRIESKANGWEVIARDDSGTVWSDQQVTLPVAMLEFRLRLATRFIHRAEESAQEAAQ